MTQEYKQQIEELAIKWFEKLVPVSGKADTKGGEIMRAAMRLLYRYHNAGNVVRSGYGLTTCWSSAMFLIDNAPAEIAEEAAGLWRWGNGDYGENDDYDNQLHSLMTSVILYLESDREDSRKPNDISCIDWAEHCRPDEYEEEDND